MAISRTRKRRQQLKGLIPTLGCRLAAALKWAFGHPKPILLGFFFGVTFWGIFSFVQQADAFRIVSVSVPADLALTLPDHLIGQNIWQADLQGLSQRLSEQRPDLKEIRVVRQLPNSIRIHAIQRVPIAQLRLEQWHLVDEEGFILPPGQAQPFERVVRLSGFLRSETPLRAGRANKDERLKLALRALPIIQKSPVMASRQLLELNVSDMQQIRFVLDGGLEIRCGTEAELQAHLARLQATLKTLARQSPLSMRYIDVRFQDPVVGPQQAGS